ncbi:hypothetical protein TNCV_3482291 [Trichonephila clavipes]|nr:hypothetical protein TNCV_3482291 [Trichonephila clavipes]
MIAGCEAILKVLLYRRYRATSGGPEREAETRSVANESSEHRFSKNIKSTTLGAELVFVCYVCEPEFEQGNVSVTKPCLSPPNLE